MKFIMNMWRMQKFRHGKSHILADTHSPMSTSRQLASSLQHWSARSPYHPWTFPKPHGTNRHSAQHTKGCAESPTIRPKTSAAAKLIQRDKGNEHKYSTIFQCLACPPLSSLNKSSKKPPSCNLFQIKARLLKDQTCSRNLVFYWSFLGKFSCFLRWRYRNEQNSESVRRISTGDTLNSNLLVPPFEQSSFLSLPNSAVAGYHIPNQIQARPRERTDLKKPNTTTD